MSSSEIQASFELPKDREVTSSAHQEPIAIIVAGGASSSAASSEPTPSSGGHLGYAQLHLHSPDCDCDDQQEPDLEIDDGDFEEDSPVISPWRDLPATPLISWATAAQEALDGVHYVRDKFPSDDGAYLSAVFRREPLKVEKDDKVLILDEVTEFAIRVRVLRTDTVGVVPMWNVEGALERLARVNMELNGIVSVISSR